jgi:hypothetical protein
MTREIIEKAMAEGVVLALAAGGDLKATGDPDAIGRWLPSLREHKAEIIAVLVEDEIVGWLAWIGEDDEAIIAEVLDCCQRDADVRNYFLSRAMEQRGAVLKPAPWRN